MSAKVRAIPWRSALLSVLILGASGILVELGRWQWQRRGEKLEFLAKLAKASSSAPVAFAESLPFDVVTLTGRFDHARTRFVQTSRPGEGFGLGVMTPLHYRDCKAGASRCEEAVIFIHRGFVPVAPGAEIPPFPKPAGEIEVTGLRRPSEAPGWFPPHDAPERGLYFRRSSAVMARELGPGVIAREEYIDRLAEPGEAAPFGLVPLRMIATLPNNHLGYALTWWGLAIVAVLVGGLVLVQNLRREHKPADSPPDLR